VRAVQAYCDGMGAGDVMTDQPLDTARRFIAAFNERDAEALRRLVDDDVALRKVNGDELRGEAGLRALLAAAEDFDLRLVPVRTGTVADRADGTATVAIPLRELIGPDDIERVAQFTIRDGRVTAFAIRPYTT
jgi:limonene-1,2-epoxide hydrolase